MESTLKERVSAFDILLSVNAEDFIEEYFCSTAIADTGDYSTDWDEDKLRNLLKVGQHPERRPIKKILNNLDEMYWSLCGQKMDQDNLKGWIIELIRQVDEGNINTSEFSPLEMLRQNVL